MFINHFFKVSWVVQLLVGTGLFTVSFLIENRVMLAFLATPMLALSLTIALEVGKAVSIVWYRYMVAVSDSYSVTVRIASWLFRIGLMVLSITCSLLFLGERLDRPYLEEVRINEIQALEERNSAELKRLEQQHRDVLTEVQQRQAYELEIATNRHESRVSKLEADRRMEMDNVINGTFKGERYKELGRLIELERTAHRINLQKISARHQMERSGSLSEQIEKNESSRMDVLDDLKEQREILMQKDYSMDERVNDPRIVALSKTVEAVFGWLFEPLQFVFVFSVLISILVELGILIAFDTITAAMLPTLMAQHEAEIETEVLRTRMAGEAQREDILHDSELNRGHKRADRTMDEAESMMKNFKKRAR